MPGHECLLVSEKYASVYADTLKEVDLVILPMQPPDPSKAPFQDWSSVNVLTSSETGRITGAYASEDLQMSW
jgi:hypothetical protein